MKRLAALVLAALMILGMTACGQKKDECKSKLDQIKEAGVLVVGTSADYSPFEFHTQVDGQDTIVGIDISICQYIADQLGVQLKVVDMNFDNLVMGLKNGDFDIVSACMSADDKRRESIDFTDIVYNTDTVLVTKKEVADNYQKPEDLAGHKIAAQTGSKPYERAVAFAGTENMVGLAKVPDLILEVQNGKTEGAVMDELVAQAYVNADPSLAISPLRFDIGSDSGIRIGVQKGNDEFVTYLNQVIAGLHEFNPMMGHRGCRLAVTYPEIAEMQTNAVIKAALKVSAETGKMITPHIMIPLVGEVKELKYVKEIVVATADKLIAEAGVDMKYQVGTMIEIPRAALTAGDIAKEAEFFSFGTNDLTQMTFGFSRDDAAKFLGAYYEKKIYESDPFQHLDQIGVGKLIKMAAHDGRETRPDLGLGICGEHGGDPSSVEFCHNVGLDYVSCSPFRVPIARLAAAQAAIKNPRK